MRFASKKIENDPRSLTVVEHKIHRSNQGSNDLLIPLGAGSSSDAGTTPGRSGRWWLSERGPGVGRRAWDRQRASCSRDGLAHGGKGHGGLVHGGLAHDGLAHGGLAHGGLVHGGLAHDGLDHGVVVEDAAADLDEWW